VSDELDPKKFHVLSRESKIKVTIISLIFLFVVLPPLFYLYYDFAVKRPSQTSREVTFEIKKGQSLSEISENLYQESAINSRFLFSFFAVINKVDKNIQAGIYTVKAGSSIQDLAQLFQHGTLDEKITFLEGWRIEEFARKASQTYQDVTYKQFMEKAERSEGYLFPDTYIFSRDVTSKEIVTHLREVFDRRTKELLSKEYLESSGLSSKQAVIIASIVEREVVKDDDRRLVAGILIKRWREGMKLEADATTQYVVANVENYCSPDRINLCTENIDVNSADWWQRGLTFEDLDIDSPFNTRKNIGLPPVPISSISISSLKAVLNYEPTNFYYYLTDESGETHYSEVLAEHEANIAEYLDK